MAKGKEVKGKSTTTGDWKTSVTSINLPDGMKSIKVLPKKGK